LDGFFASGFGCFIGRFTVRYRVQMIFGTPVSGFEKKSEEIIWKKVLAVQQYAEFGLEESCGGGENGLSGKERDDICLVRSRSRLTGVALDWHQRRCLILEAGRPMRESASPKLDASRCPLSLDLAVGSARQSCPKNRKASA
jgi:hypothetical protein